MEIEQVVSAKMERVANGGQRFHCSRIACADARMKSRRLSWCNRHLSFPDDEARLEVALRRWDQMANLRSFSANEGFAFRRCLARSALCRLRLRDLQVNVFSADQSNPRGKMIGLDNPSRSDDRSGRETVIFADGVFASN